MAEDFSKLIGDIKRVFPNSDLELVPEITLSAIRKRHPKVPKHYLDFLRHVGFGRLGKGNFMIYNGLCNPDELFDAETVISLEGILFFGDDYGGWNAGFDTRDGWSIVGVGNSNSEPFPEETRTLAQFVAQRIKDFE